MRKFVSFAGSARKFRAGYTLIELAIVMVVAGLMIASFMSAYNIYLRTQAEQNTDQRISEVTTAMSQYLVAFGAYPCPAPINVARSDPTYGVAGDCSVAGPAAGNFAGGIWGETSNRTVSDTRVVGTPAALTSGAALTVKIYNTGSTTTFTNHPVTLPVRSAAVRRGMVPFRTLGLVEDQAYDGYRQRLHYAVTEALAVAGTYLESGGAIDIQDGEGHSLFKAPGLPVLNASGDFAIDQNGNSILVDTAGGAAHYVIFSTGVDLQGAFNFEGKNPNVCTSSGRDAENCNTASAAVYVAAPYSTAHQPCPAPATGTDCHFDDHVKYYSEIESPLWKVSSNTMVGKDIQDLIKAGGTGTGKIGIGATPASTISAALQVHGDVHVTGNLVAGSLCDAAGANCVTTPLTGSCTGSTRYATRLRDGKVADSDCVTSSTAGKITCDTGKLAHGFNGKQLLCSNEVYCGSALKNLCQSPAVANSDNRWLPASPNNTTIDTRNLTAVAPAVAGTGGVSGSSYYETWKCNGGSWSRTATSGVCNCTAETNAPHSQACYIYRGQSNPLTYSNNVTWTSTTVCPAGTTTTSAVNTSACVCNNLDIPTVTTNTCSAGYVGGPVVTTTHAKFNCNGAGIGSWNYTTDPVVGVCTCDSSYPAQTRNADCPEGYTGTVPQTNPYVCSGGTGSYSGWTPAIGNPPPSPQCTCSGGVEYDPNVPCGTGQVGTKTQVRTFDCNLSPPDWTAWQDYDNTQCGVVTYVWKPVGSPDSGSYSTALGNEAFKSCSPSGATGDCSQANGSSYIYYLNSGCQCQ